MKNFSLILGFLFFSTFNYAQDTVVLKNYINNLKKVDVEISGKSYSFLFDTGGGETMISPGIAKELNKNVHGQVAGYRMSGEMIIYPVCDSITISIGHTKIFHTTVGVWDLMRILPKDFPELNGIISLHSFKDRIISLDLKNNWLIIENESSFKKQISKSKILRGRFANGLAGNELNIFLPVYKNKTAFWFLFDSGNIGNLLFSHHAAYEWKLEKDSITINKEFGEVSIALGNKKLNTTAESASIIYDGALNFNLISKSVYTIDFVHRKIWMK